MRTYPEGKDDQKEVQELHVEPWMIEQLKLNPAYPHWGPHEDYMIQKGEGWNSAVTKKTWAEFGPWELDEMNECVHFYFQLWRASKQCGACGATGYHPDALWVTESWYEHASPFRIPPPDEAYTNRVFREKFGLEPRVDVIPRGSFPSEELFKKYAPEFRTFCEAMRDGDGHWNDKITQSEVDALVKSNRLREWIDGKWVDVPRTAAEVNAAQANGFGNTNGLQSHDAINQHVAVKERLARYGIPVECLDCKGSGHVYTEPTGHLGLVLWMIHPRKGASRGIEIDQIEKDELPAVYRFLATAAKRNAERFEKIKEQL